MKFEKYHKFNLGRIPWNKGIPCSEKTKEKISQALRNKRRSPKTEFKKENNPWNKGLTKETDIRVKKVSDKLMNNKCSSGRILSKKHKERLSESLKNREITWKDKISKTLKGCWTGKKNPNWKGGISSFHSKIRSLLEYKQWIREVFKRDNWTCQKCWQKGVHLHAHHIIRFAEILSIQEIRSIEDAINCKQLWETKNGLTLCKKCHKLEIIK